MPVARETVRDHIRRTLTERILSGHYAPGERLVELRIAHELGTSQGSVREALRALEASRLVETEPRRGTRVRVVSPHEEREAYFVRGVLEEAAAPAAVAALGGDVAELRAEADGVLRACAAGDRAAQAAHVYAFHRRVVEAAGNEVLLRVWESLALETRVRLRLANGDIDPAVVEASYDAIIDAVARGDGAGAGGLLRAHAETFAPAAPA